MHAADLAPVAPGAQTQSGWDLFLIFAAANIVATTLQVGASLAAVPGTGWMLALVLVGVPLGAALVAALAPVGSRLGVPSMVAARAVLGHRGAAIVATVLFVTNFAWIAVNNVIAASVVVPWLPDGIDPRVAAALLGVVATAIAAGGPAMVRRADRVAVPSMALAGLVITWAVVRAWRGDVPAAPATLTPLTGLDVVAGYQVSWLLMFADYSRFTRSARVSAWAVWLGLTLTAWWLMPLGWALARLAGGSDPGAMLGAVDAGIAAALLITLATVTTNFVNIYLSSLAWRSVMPVVPESAAVWTVGLVGTALGALSAVWLDRFAAFMTVVGALLVPVGGVLVAHFVVRRAWPRVADLYDASGPLGGVRWTGLVAWAIGIAVYALFSGTAATAPAFIAAVAAYLVLEKLIGGQTPFQPGPE
ncbi:MAG: cytosine permease [Vicinamibacterales bacterium]